MSLLLWNKKSAAQVRGRWGSVGFRPSTTPFWSLTLSHSDAIKRYRFTWAIVGAKYTQVA